MQPGVEVARYMYALSYVTLRIAATKPKPHSLPLTLRSRLPANVNYLHDPR